VQHVRLTETITPSTFALVESGDLVMERLPVVAEHSFACCRGSTPTWFVRSHGCLALSQEGRGEGCAVDGLSLFLSSSLGYPTAPAPGLQGCRRGFMALVCPGMTGRSGNKDEGLRGRRPGGGRGGGNAEG
jgi:hypothetical protein